MLFFWWAFTCLLALLRAGDAVPDFENAPVFEVRSIGFGDALATVKEQAREILAQDGIIAVSGIPNLRIAREAALKATADCTKKIKDDEANPVRVVLQDGTTRFTWAAHVNHMQTDAFPEMIQCQSLQKEMEKLQAVVNVGSLYFSQLLDEAIRTSPTNVLFSRADGAGYTRFTDLVSNGTHLDHFHVYQSDASSMLEFENEMAGSPSSLPLHTDQGLFIAIVPSIRFSEFGVEKQEDSFFVEGKDKSLIRVRFPLSGDVLVFMIGDGFNYIAKRSTFPVYVVPHALSLPRFSQKTLRSWFGRMFFTPSDALLSKRGESFQSILKTVMDAKPDFPRLGCSEAEPRRMLQDSSGQDCNEGELYCWLSCQSISGLPCSENEVTCQSGNGQIWQPCDDCHDYSAKLVCPTLAPTPQGEIDVDLDPLLSLRYNINGTYATFRLTSAQPGYIALGIGASMSLSVAIIGMDTTANPTRPGVGIYKIIDADGNLLNLATTLTELQQYGIIQSSFETQASSATLTFIMDAASQNPLFKLLQNNLNIIYAVGPVSLTYDEHDAYGVRYSIDFSSNANGPPKNLGVYLIDPLLGAHIIMMILAWQVISPTGVLIALFSNPKHNSGSRHSMCTSWFRFHWVLQTLAVVMGYIAALLGYLHVQNRQSLHWNTPHKIVGLVVVLLSILQPLMGHFRPHLTENPSLKRRVFEVGHPLMGYSLVILAMTNALLGIREIATVSGKQPYLSFMSASQATAQGFGGALGIVILVLLSLFATLLLGGWFQRLLKHRSGPQTTSSKQVDIDAL